MLRRDIPALNRPFDHNSPLVLDADDGQGTVEDGGVVALRALGFDSSLDRRCGSFVGAARGTLRERAEITSISTSASH